MSEPTYGTESSFGPNAGIDGGETSYEADVNAGYDDDDEETAPIGASDAGDEGVPVSHEADVAAGYDERRDSDASDDSA